MIWVLVGALATLCIFEGALLWKASGRLLRQDSALESAADTLTEYGEDLRKMASGGVLASHPEVVAFHRRNVEALKGLLTAIGRIEDARTMRVPSKRVGLPPKVE